MLRVSVIVAFFIVAACATTPKQQSLSSINEPAAPKAITENSTFHVRLNVTENPLFIGQMNTDANGAKGRSIQYAGDAGFGGLLAQIAIHAAMNSAAQNKKLNAAQKQANLVLETYAGILNNLTHESVYESTVAIGTNSKYSFTRYSENEPKATDNIVLDLSPVYEITQDESSIKLQLNGKVFRHLAPNDIVYEQTIESIARPLDTDSLQDGWSKGEPSNLQITVQQLYSEAVSLLVEDLLSEHATNTPEKQSTYRYIYGGKKRYERASLIKETCDRIYLRNLKRHIVAIPKPEACTSS